jgi:4-hydroxy-4-methyl-2-oxoglutarate aldolase
MFIVNDPPSQIAPARLALLLKAEPATIGHFRQVGFMDPHIRALLPDRRIAGTAVTIRFDGDDTSIVHYDWASFAPATSW